MSGSRIEQFKEILALDPNDEVVHYGLGEEYLRAGMFEEAVQEFETVIRLKPDYTAAYRELGKALEKGRRIEEAKEAYRKGIEVGSWTGDLQTKKEMEVFLKRLGKG
ncbi:MAG: tetratricopeptide repeat protein [candidate division NC10 bacterium]|nr:tetratricopeptide repeat protein [candidate division NC10 bacterium]